MFRVTRGLCAYKTKVVAILFIRFYSRRSLFDFLVNCNGVDTDSMGEQATVGGEGGHNRRRWLVDYFADNRSSHCQGE